MCHMYLRLFIFLYSFYFMFSSLDNFGGPIAKSSDFFFCQLKSDIETHKRWLFVSIIAPFNARVSVWAFFFKHQLINIFYLVIHYSLLLINSLGCGALKILYIFKYLIWNLQLVHLTSGLYNGQLVSPDWFFFPCKDDNSMLLCMFQKFFIEKQTYKIIQYNSSGNQTQNLLLFVCLFRDPLELIK